jgi:hypothetical protein
MKTFLFAILIAFVSQITTAQTNKSQAKEQEESKAEKFSAKAGTLMQKEFLEIGKIKKCEIKVVHYTDLVSSENTSALKFEFEYVSNYSSDTKSAVLDVDEIDGLIKSIKLIQEKTFPSTPTNYTEVSFKSRGGFEAGCYWSKGEWKTYLKLEKFDGNSYVWLTKDDFPTLLTMLEQAKLKM